MRTTPKILTLAALATGFALPALAGGMTQPVAEPVIYQAAPVMALSADWTGAYVGAQLGYGDGDVGGVSGNGALYGVHAGYRYDFGQFVTGVELDYDSTNLDASPGNSIDSLTRLKFSAGADVGKALLYVTAGPAYGTATIGGTSRTDNGYFLGLGAAYAVSDQMTVGAEILGNRFDDFDGTLVDVKATTVTARISYRF
jgi:outer membrane immunogenic protein